MRVFHFCDATVVLWLTVARASYCAACDPVAMLTVARPYVILTCVRFKRKWIFVDKIQSTLFSSTAYECFSPISNTARTCRSPVTRCMCFRHISFAVYKTRIEKLHVTKKKNFLDYYYIKFFIKPVSTRTEHDTACT